MVQPYVISGLKAQLEEWLCSWVCLNAAFIHGHYPSLIGTSAWHSYEALPCEQLTCASLQQPLPITACLLACLLIHIAHSLTTRAHGALDSAALLCLCIMKSGVEVFPTHYDGVCFLPPHSSSPISTWSAWELSAVHGRGNYCTTCSCSVSCAALCAMLHVSVMNRCSIR